MMFGKLAKHLQIAELATDMHSNARVFGVIVAAASAGSILNSPSRLSQSTGRAPRWITTAAVAAKV
jgi:hypothetical protein